MRDAGEESDSSQRKFLDLNLCRRVRRAVVVNHFGQCGKLDFNKRRTCAIPGGMCCGSGRYPLCEDRCRSACDGCDKERCGVVAAEF